MISKRIFPRPVLLGLAGALLFTVGASAPALSQDDGPPPQAAQAQPPAGIEWDKKRLDRLERAVERLENTIAHMRPDKAPPNLVEPDPEVVALEARADELTAHIGDLESALRKVNGDLDNASLALDRSHKAEADDRAANDALSARVTALEGKIADMEKAQAAAAAAAPAPAADGSAAPGSLGPSPTGDSAAEFRSAMALMTNGDYSGASKAFADFVGRWPNAPETPEAHYRLAETYYVRDDQPNSALEYAASLKDWPHAKWAPDATVKLAQAFSNLGHDKDACATIGEFDRRYAKEATASVKSRAATLKTKAKCGH